VAAGWVAALALVVNGGILVAAEDGRVNINTASVNELTELPGVGPAKAAAIVEERERKPFASVDDLTRVSGIGDRMLDQLRDKISVGGGDGRSGADNRSGAESRSAADARPGAAGSAGAK
jgi:competence protein ComEA